MKQTLIQIVQSILSDMDSSNVNSINDSVEAQQIASVVEDVYFSIVTNKDVPEHNQLLKLTAFADSTKPTHFTIPTNTKEIQKLFYNKSTDGSFNFQEIYFLEPLEFLRKQRKTLTNAIQVSTSDYTLVIVNNKMPMYYTSFDDGIVIMNSYDASVESTLQESKIRAYGTVYPSFSVTDSHVPDMDDSL